MLDTKFWIQMKEDIDDFERFYNVVSGSDDIEVYFSFGNLVDLVKAEEQDVLSKIIANTVDTYIPPLPSSGDHFQVTEDPIEMVPDPVLKQDIRKETRGKTEEETLRVIFRASNWTPTNKYEQIMEQYRSISGDYEFKHLKALAFDDYLEERDDGMLELRQEKVDIIEFVKKIIYAHRIELLAPDEKIDANDLADMTICVHAIVSSCDHLLIEEKWANVDIVRRVTDELEQEQSINVQTEFDDLLSELS